MLDAMSTNTQYHRRGIRRIFRTLCADLREALHGNLSLPQCIPVSSVAGNALSIALWFRMLESQYELRQNHDALREYYLFQIAQNSSDHPLEFRRTLCSHRRSRETLARL